ncbi:MAG: ABC transporter permease subunit [Paracoccaceae bacterium]
MASELGRRAGADLPVDLAPFTTWLLKAGFDAIPRDLEAAAAIDGARLDQTLRIVILPLAAPVLSTAALFALLLAWDEFFMRCFSLPTSAPRR